ncbi:MAG: sulfotransferase, partial [Gammaproteobacteria bacterium]|nr:sulfotransferase [Gammaproteobacteria bacterium]
MLTGRGQDIIKRRYVNALASRMQVDDYIRTNPQVLETPVERPVFILGLVRTGTTMASYLMDADPATRSLLRWEAYNVAPPAAPGLTRTDPRCLAETAQDEEMIKSNPGMFATTSRRTAHRVRTTCWRDFRSMMFTALSTTPVYADWILHCDMSSAFEHRKRAFQILQSTNPGRWVLKMPSDSV